MNVQVVLDFFFPPQCGACGEPGSGLCERCVPCSEPLSRALETLHVRALGSYDAGLRKAVLALKSGRRDVARTGALRLCRLLQPGCTLVPVPTTAARRRERGFDGCVLMAGIIAKALGAGVFHGLRQVRGDHQRGRSRDERLAARGRFVWRGEPLQGMNVLLLDDVVTTGATLEDCARAVRGAGGSVRQAVALAITL